MIQPVRPAADPLPQTAAEPAREAPARQPLADGVERDLAEVRFLSPVVRLDVDTQTALLVYRDAATGDTVRQIPNERTLAQYRQQGARAEAASSQAEPASAVSEEIGRVQVERSVGAGIAAGGPAANEGARTQRGTERAVEAPLAISV